MIDKAEEIKEGIRAKMEHTFRVVKRQFGFMDVRYRELKKNTAQLLAPFTLIIPWLVRGKLNGSAGISAPNREIALQRVKNPTEQSERRNF